MNKAAKIIVEVLLALVACGLVYLIVRSVSKPVEFKKEQARREQVGIQRLKDIRTLQVAFKGVHNHYTPSVDSLIQFYNDGKMEIVMQIGSNDDSLAVVNTAAIKKKKTRNKDYLPKPKLNSSEKKKKKDGNFLIIDILG